MKDWNVVTTPHHTEHHTHSAVSVCLHPHELDLLTDAMAREARSYRAIGEHALADLIEARRQTFMNLAQRGAPVDDE